MNWILAIPIAWRLACLFAIGVILGGLANWCIYRLAFDRRWISPWSRSPDQVPPRRWTDRLPIVGWLGLRREESFHGKRFWVRPIVVELATGGILCLLYWWEVERLGLFPPFARALAGANLIAVAHCQFLAHAILVLLMIVTSLIDLDEKTIPDALTVPGALIALAFAALLPQSALRDWDAGPIPLAPPAAPRLEPLTLASPNAWPDALDGFPRVGSLGLGLGCFWLWCVGLLHRPWRTRHGLKRAIAILVARVARDPASKVIASMALGGGAYIAAAWWRGGDGWRGLLSSLVGLAASGLLVWLVRVIAGAVLAKEAMGFGDVTLLAMLGAFLGWQSGLIVFFLAPFAALVIGLVQWMARREHEVPYGPFLCLAALFVIFRWPIVWDRASHIFALPWLVPAVLAACMVLLAVLLSAIRLVRR